MQWTHCSLPHNATSSLKDYINDGNSEYINAYGDKEEDVGFKGN